MSGRSRKTEDWFDAIASELEPQPVTTTGPETPEGVVDFLDEQDLPPSMGLLDLVGVGPATVAKVATKETTVRTARGAIEWGRQQMIDRVAAFKGLCLMFVRMCFNVPALYPDAITAWEQAERKTRGTPANAPRGRAGFFRGGDHGHVVMCLGNGRCLTNDTGAPGTINVAMIVDIEQAWGYTFLGWTNDLNGESPVPRVRASKPRMTDRQWRIRMLRRAMLRARAAGDAHRVRRIRRWLNDVLGR